MKTVEELKKDQDYAKAKLHELVDFINSEEFYTLSKSEQGLINQERVGLELYLTSLTKRVCNTPNESDASSVLWMTLLYGMFNSGGGFSSNSGTYAFKEALEKKESEENKSTEDESGQDN